MEQSAYDARLDRQVRLHDVRAKQPLRLDAGIGFDHADPITLGFLRRQKPVRGAGENVFDAGIQGRPSGQLKLGAS
jgi:hypothetical protein